VKAGNTVLLALLVLAAAVASGADARRELADVRDRLRAHVVRLAAVEAVLADRPLLDWF